MEGLLYRENFCFVNSEQNLFYIYLLIVKIVGSFPNVADIATANGEVGAEMPGLSISKAGTE